MGQIVDISGRTFGRLTVIEYAYSIHRAAHWTCECDCGSFTVARGSKLRRGEMVSCGCQRRDARIKRAIRLMMPAPQRQEIATAAAVARWGESQSNATHRPHDTPAGA